MDNKKQPQQNFTRSNNSKAAQSDSASSQRKSTDLQSKKSWPRNSRRGEQTAVPQQQRSINNNNISKQQSQRFNNFDKRPRPCGGGFGSNASSYNASACPSDDFATGGAGLVPTWLAYGSANGAVARYDQQLEDDLYSVYEPGSKKQNLNHLLNFHYTPRKSAAEYHIGMSVFGRGGGGGGGGMQRGKKHKYNKEQFMQANFQFVIKSSVKPKLTASPDTLIDWNLIEQINIQTTEEPQCPICLYPPIAAKMTRCGHAYCWPCILHYLALSDKTWRKCPICYEAIHTADLKSTSILEQRPINVNTEITFRLMRREKGSMFIEHFKSAAQPAVTRYPQVGHGAENDAKLYAKFLIAKRSDILDIIDREQRELLADEDSTCPEFVFVQQALEMLKERREKLGAIADFKKEEDETEGAEEIKIGDTLDLYAEGTPTDKVEEAKIPLDESVASSTDGKTAETLPAAPTKTTNITKFYYFYQSVDGQNIYLHPLNVKMLQMCYGTLDHAPLIISARILQKEHHSMDEDHRRKFTCLGHLPLTCQFAVVEVDLQSPIVSDDIVQLFKDDLFFRKKERQRREREERKREKKIDEINDRQMGKLIASTTNINLSSSHEFPTCGFEEVLLSSDGADFQLASAPGAIDVTNPHASYSAIAVGASQSSNASSRGYQELHWGRANNPTARSTLERSNECLVMSSNGTNLSEVLAEAFSQKKQTNAAPQQAQQGANSVIGSGGGNKKNKKAKKMLPLFSTGMNYNCN